MTNKWDVRCYSYVPHNGRWFHHSVQGHALQVPPLRHIILMHHAETTQSSHVMLQLQPFLDACVRAQITFKYKGWFMFMT